MSDEEFWDEEEDYYQVEAPILVHRGRLVEYEVRNSSDNQRHTFGGEYSGIISGQPAGQPGLHLLGVIDLTDPQLGVEDLRITSCPLLYGFRFDGCVLKYVIDKQGNVSTIELNNMVADPDWPYESYPDVFPRADLCVAKVIDIPTDDPDDYLSTDIDFDTDQKILVVIPPSSRYGVSLWGEMGDAEEVKVVFEIDPLSGCVHTYNQCS